MPRLTPSDWCRAALFAFGARGEAGFAVEPLARSLGVTKGSFYWHFDDRKALVTEALAFWRREGTEQVIAGLESLPDDRDRLRGLFAVALRDVDELAVEAALQAAAARGHEVIGPVVDEVNRARMAYLRELYVRLSGPDWSDAAYAAYLGACQLAAMRPGLVDRERLARLVRTLQERFVPGPSHVGAR